MFTPYEYTWVSPGKGLVQVGAFVAAFLGVVWLVGVTYPDRPSYPREFEGGLERELGGAGALRVSGFPRCLLTRFRRLNQTYRQELRATQIRNISRGIAMACTYCQRPLQLDQVTVRLMAQHLLRKPCPLGAVFQPPVSERPWGGTPICDYLS